MSARNHKKRKHKFCFKAKARCFASWCLHFPSHSPHVILQGSLSKKQARKSSCANVSQIKQGPWVLNELPSPPAWQAASALCILPTPHLSMPTAISPIIFFPSLHWLPSLHFVWFYGMIKNKAGRNLKVSGVYPLAARQDQLQHQFHINRFLTNMYPTCS